MLYKDSHLYGYIEPCVIVNTAETGEILNIELDGNNVILYGKDTGVIMRGGSYEFHRKGAVEALKALLDDYSKSVDYYTLEHLSKLVSAITGMELEYTKEFLKDGVDKVFQNGQPRVFKPVDEEEGD